MNLFNIFNFLKIKMLIMRLLFLVFLLVSFQSISQNDTLLSNVYATWVKKFSCFDSQGGNISGVIRRELFNDSVMINNKYWSTYYQGNDIKGYVRIDSNLVYVKYDSQWNGGDTSVQLLYDFNLNIGDTAYQYNDFSNTIVVVNYIGDTIIDSKTRKYYLFDDFGIGTRDVWIQGIGSVKGLFFPTEAFIEGIGCGSAYCYYGEYIDSLGVMYTIQSDNTGCIANISNNKPLFQIIQNENEIIVKSSNLENHSYYLYGLRGEIILTGIIQSSNHKIGLTNLSTGVYILNLAGHSQKLFKQ